MPALQWCRLRRPEGRVVTRASRIYTVEVQRRSWHYESVPIQVSAENAKAARAAALLAAKSDSDLEWDDAGGDQGFDDFAVISVEERS